MAITFAYTESTNTIVVTEGTSGTPATFAGFVTADRAGTDTDLLIAASPGAAVALTYAVRPVEDLAILVKCIVANKTAEADFIFITGTDWRGAAQTESIDVTAGDGSYTSTKYWASITTLDCSDNSAGGGTVWADGDLSVTQDVWGVIWDYGNRQYLVDSNFNIGDGSTATYFASLNDQVYFANSCYPAVTANATLQIGTADGSYSGNGSSWVFPANNTNPRFGANATTAKIYCYSSYLQFRNSHMVTAGAGTAEFEFYDSIVVAEGAQTLSWINWTENLKLRNMYLFNLKNLQPGSVQIAQLEDVHTHNPEQGAFFTGAGTPVVDGMKVTSADHDARIWIANAGLLMQDPVYNIANPEVGSSGFIQEQYTCNIHVADKDGANLASVTVLCENEADAQVFSVSTDANGDIAEQAIPYKRWAGTSETETAYSPHKFTLSKAGHETLVLEAITVDSPIVWHLELQDPGGGGTRLFIVEEG